MRRATDLASQSLANKWVGVLCAAGTGGRAGSAEASRRCVGRFAAGAFGKSQQSDVQAGRQSAPNLLDQLGEGGKARARSATAKA